MTRLVLLLALAVTSVAPATAQPVGTAFTYQGRLTDGATPADGVFDFQLVLFDAASGGAQVGPILTPGDLGVTQGLFTVALDFGPVFGANRRWLEIGVRPGGSTGAYAILSPRQELTATPAALFSTAAPWTGVVGKPAGFADDVDDDTTYTAGAGIAVVGTVIGIGGNAVTGAMIQDGAVGTNDLAVSSVIRTKIAGSAVGSTEIEDGTVGVADLDTVGVDARYLNASEELTGTNYGGCGTYMVASCALFPGFTPGPACDQVPVGSLCRVIGAAVCPGTAGGTCGDGGTWYLKITP
jgi:hypothetical protein